MSIFVRGAACGPQCQSGHKFKIQNYRFGSRLAKCPHERTRVSGPSRGEAAARTAFARPKFMIQNSIFKISCSTEPRGSPAAERTGLRRRGAALRQGAAAGCWSLRVTDLFTTTGGGWLLRLLVKLQIKDDSLRFTSYADSISGRNLRSTRARRGAADRYSERNKKAKEPNSPNRPRKNRPGRAACVKHAGVPVESQRSPQAVKRQVTPRRYRCRP